MVKVVGVMGVGPAGLAATKRMHEAGFKVIAWERWPDVGGSWHHCYEHLRLQSQKTAFAFNDYPMPEDYPMYPSNKQMVAYFHSYIDHYGIADCIRNNCKVTDAKPRDGGGWTVTIEESDPLRPDAIPTVEDYEVDFLVNCAGICCYERMPSEESMPGKADFEAAGGTVIHTYHLNNGLLDEVIEKTKLRRASEEDKRVRMVVLGFGKSGLDVGTSVADRDDTYAPVHYVYRNPRWFTPEYLWGFIHHRHALYSPFMQVMPPWFKPSFTEQLVYLLTRPITLIFILLWQFWLKRHFRSIGVGVPDTSILSKHPTCSFFLEPPKFQSQIKDKKLIFHPRNNIASFDKDGVTLKDGTKLGADIVILGTGYMADWSWLPAAVQDKVIHKDDGYLWLYKHVIHPDLPDMGFVGYQSAFNSLGCFDVAASWLASYLKGEVKKESREVMLKDLNARKDWYHAWKGTKYMAPCVAGHEYFYQRDL